MKTFTQQGLKALQQEVELYEKMLNDGVKSAVEHVTTIHQATLVAVPEDIKQRMLDATDRGDLVIREDGAISFVNEINKE